jgi:hypothetical protein
MIRNCSRAAHLWSPLLILAALLGSLQSIAGTLPEDRADALFHRFEGGGVTIQGPSILVRKTLAEKYSFTANYYTDLVTSASIDVEVSGASEYKEERNQYSVGFDLLRGKSTYSLSFTDSDEDDYQSQTTSFGVSHDMFGDLTTVNFGFSRGNDVVRRSAGNMLDPTFERAVDKRSYRLGISQILTKSLITSLGLEVITDEGFLNNPYRSYRFLDPEDNSQFALAAELYPNTRTSNAVAFNGRYFLPYRAAVQFGYRFFTDTWGINADTFELGYIQPLKGKYSPWTLSGKLRYYTQGSADFYSDLFARMNQQNFLARDKELSTFTSQTVSVGATYEFSQGWKWVKKGTVNLYLDFIRFDYDDFRDARFSMRATDDPNFRPAGSEPLYKFNATVYQLFVSIWF